LGQGQLFHRADPDPNGATYAAMRTDGTVALNHPDQGEAYVYLGKAAQTVREGAYGRFEVVWRVGESRNFVRQNDSNATKIKFEPDPLQATGQHPEDPSHAPVTGIPEHRSVEAALVRRNDSRESRGAAIHLAKTS
jgi:hypothetical protein